MSLNPTREKNPIFKYRIIRKINVAFVHLQVSAYSESVHFDAS